MQHTNESQPDASDLSITEAKEASSLEPKIDITDFAKVEVRVGKVVLCERVPDTDK